MTDEHQNQLLRVLKTRLNAILTPDQVELPPVKLTHYLITSLSLTVRLFCSEINAIAAQEYNILVLTSTFIAKEKCFYIYMSKLNKGHLFFDQWHYLCLTDTTLYSHFLEHSFANLNVSTIHLHACSVAQSCPTLYDPRDCSLPGPSVHGIFQARILEWSGLPFPTARIFPTQGLNLHLLIGRWILYHYITRRSSPFT